MIVLNCGTIHNLDPVSIQTLALPSQMAGHTQSRQYRPAVAVYQDSNGVRRIRLDDKVHPRTREMIKKIKEGMDVLRRQSRGNYAGHFVTGGFVRDLLLGRNPNDGDLGYGYDAHNKIS